MRLFRSLAALLCATAGILGLVGCDRGTPSPGGSDVSPAPVPPGTQLTVSDLGLDPEDRDIDARTAAAVLERFGDRDDVVLLDVRTSKEIREGHPAGAEMLDFYASDFREKAARLDPTRAYLVFCRSGNRSGQTTKVLRALGFPGVWNVKGGVISWNRAKLPLATGDAKPAVLRAE